MFEVKDGRLAYKKKAADSLWLESYYFSGKSDYSYPDSLYLFFSNRLKDVKLSLSPKEEQLRNKKQVRAEFIFNPYVDQSMSLEIPRRRICFEISEIRIEKKKQIIELLEDARRALKP